MTEKKKYIGPKYHRTEIEHHLDGSHTVRHHRIDGGPHVSYAAADLDGIHDGLEDHIGTPNPGEAAKSPAHDAAEKEGVIRALHGAAPVGA
jgi:hypothetical protein